MRCREAVAVAGIFLATVGAVLAICHLFGAIP
jgi:hypothetical protein